MCIGKNVLVGFEESQTVCTAFRRRGFYAFSNDLKPCGGLRKEWHLQMDFFEAVKLKKWDLIILHPPCTYTALCGNRWYAGTDLRKQGGVLCRDAWIAATGACDFVALEQPMTTVGKLIGKHTQTIHPWQHGHGEQKETWLWLKNLPQLLGTNIVAERIGRVHAMPPSKHRGMLRSKTYLGIANAMAQQWGDYIRSKGNI